MFISVPALVVGMVITGLLLVANVGWNIAVFFRDRRLRSVSAAPSTD
jgi:hypothetical protein